MRFPLHELFDDVPPIRILDVGASPIDGPPPYQPLLDGGRATVVGFEPDEAQYRALAARDDPHATYLPYAVGDGAEGVLRVCKAPGMTSLFEPLLEVLGHFHGFAEWGTVVKREPCPTRRLDDVPEARGSDYLKIDVQGGEVAVLEGAAAVLEDVLVVQTEAQLVPFYEDQPLFGDIDRVLRDAGFYLHRLLPIESRVFKPMLVNDDPYAGLSQHLWTDAVYVKRFTDFDRLETPSLLKLARILNDVYGSLDLAALALRAIDETAQSDRNDRSPRYLARIAAANRPVPAG